MTATTLSARREAQTNVAETDAVLLYHNIRTQYYQAATGSTTGTAPAATDLYAPGFLPNPAIKP